MVPLHRFHPHARMHAYRAEETRENRLIGRQPPSWQILKKEHGTYESTSEKALTDELDESLPMEDAYSLPSALDKKSWEIQTVQVKEELLRMYKFTSEQISNVANISRSLAMAYVMDQRAMLLQQSTWQNNVRMSNQVE